jgi:hypothetical protein
MRFTTSFSGRFNGESNKQTLRVNFNRKLKLEFNGAWMTSDAGLIAYCELDDVMGLIEMASEYLEDYRTGKNTQHSPLGMLGPSVYGRLGGYTEGIIFSTQESFAFRWKLEIKEPNKGRKIGCL